MTWTTGRAAARCGAAGTLAALTCTLGCCLPPILVALGAGASTAAGMADMGHTGGEPTGTLGELLGLLHRITPGLLIVSIILIAGAFGLRRPIAVVPAVLAGVVLYVSTHAQADPGVMYAGMAVSYGTWICLYLWTRPANRRHTDAPETTAGCH